MVRFVTSNRHKFEEFESVARRHGIEVEMVESDYTEMQSEDIVEIARDSSKRLSTEFGAGFFIEDAGLFIRALHGFPGPYSAYVHRTIGNDGILRLMRNEGDRSAHFLSVICYYDGEHHIFQGRADGSVALASRGAAGFGFDPIFIPDGFERTFAEMESEKNEVSHRAASSEIFFRTLAESREEKVL